VILKANENGEGANGNEKASESANLNGKASSRVKLNLNPNWSLKACWKASSNLKPKLKPSLKTKQIENTTVPVLRLTKLTASLMRKHFRSRCKERLN
jgi:hypothetical protein